MNGRWGKSGVRITDQQVRQRRMDAGKKRQEAERRHAESHAEWAAGKVVPHRITLALDRHGLYGPEVDGACRAEEPEVDQWEAGLLYPRWDQVQALAELTGVTPGFFTKTFNPNWGGPGFLRLHKTSMWSHIPQVDRDLYVASGEGNRAPVLSFPKDVVAARMRGEPSPLVPQEHGQLELF